MTGLGNAGIRLYTLARAIPCARNRPFTRRALHFPKDTGPGSRQCDQRLAATYLKAQAFACAQGRGRKALESSLAFGF
jgi:hypothetical protein